MEPETNDDPYPNLFDSDESRLAYLRGIPPEAREELARLFITLRYGMKDKGCQAVDAEIERFIELLFRLSEGFRLALRLYAGRFEVIACRNPVEILRETVKLHMASPDGTTPDEGSEDDGDAGTLS